MLEADPAAKIPRKERTRQDGGKRSRTNSEEVTTRCQRVRSHTAVVEDQATTASIQKIICSESGLGGVQNDATDGVSLEESRLGYYSCSEVETEDKPQTAVLITAMDECMTGGSSGTEMLKLRRTGPIEKDREMIGRGACLKSE